MTTTTDSELEERLVHGWEDFTAKYAIMEEEVGRGGQGIVKAVEQRDSQQRYAAKIVSFRNMKDFAELKRLERETELLQGLNHPAILRYVDYYSRCVQTPWGEDTECVLITELAEGETLGEVMKRKKFNEAELVSIREQVLDALAYIHERGIVHRDIKPDNIQYDEKTGKVKILDFGIAKVLGQTTHFSTMASGTVNYMAPEQEEGEPIPLSDVYGLGATLVALARGEEYKGVKTAQDLEGYVDKMTHLSEEFRRRTKDMLLDDSQERGRRWMLQNGRYEWGSVSDTPSKGRVFTLSSRFPPPFAVGGVVGFVAPYVLAYTEITDPYITLAGTGLGVFSAMGGALLGVMGELGYLVYKMGKSRKAGSSPLSQPIPEPTKSFYNDSEEKLGFISRIAQHFPHKSHWTDDPGPR